MRFKPGAAAGTDASEGVQTACAPPGGTRVASCEARVAHPLLSIVVPTKNERDNVGALVERLERVLPAVSMEIVFVDASDDGTAEAIERIGARSKREVVLIHQRRGGGLGAAVVEGLRAARAPWVCVMDADLQHPPELVAQLFERAEKVDVDLVVASRYCHNGDTGSFGWARSVTSRSTTTAARLLFPRRLRGVSDPMSGFFLARRESIDLDRLRPGGFKILLEILVRNPVLRPSEVPYRFGERHSGDSKATLREGLRYLSLLGRLRFARFGVVGASGLVVNTLLLAALTDLAGFYYLASAAIATQGSTLWNFAFTERWVFGDREHKRGGAGRRLVLFLAMNNAALALRGPILVLLTSSLGVHYVLSNILSLVALTLLRYALADSWIWGATRPRGARSASHSYDIHGLVSVTSEVRLPELERFRIAELIGPPNIAVRLGRLGSRDDDPPAGATHFVRYVEGLGSLGFGVEITIGDQTEARVSPLLKWSPHVLYTNVVEPILRWSFAERGYALVHGACLARGEHAFLVTARTDTGKTTTSLKLLDAHQMVDGQTYSFLSDDLTLVSPDGHVLTYPKPLTISRHTLKAVETPLLTRRERLGLLFQSRLHSRSGRRFAMLLARTKLPAATINTLVQMLIPPPKYHVERLVPEVEIAPEGRLAGLVVIQRGGEGEVSLGDREAFETLMNNSEDAFGFPPYAEIEDFLHSRNGSDLRRVERGIVARALEGVPATLVRSETMDWWRRLAEIMARNGAPLSPVDATQSVERPLTDIASDR